MGGVKGVEDGRSYGQEPQKSTIRGASDEGLETMALGNAILVV